MNRYLEHAIESAVFGCVGLALVFVGFCIGQRPPDVPTAPCAPRCRSCAPKDCVGPGCSHPIRPDTGALKPEAPR